MSVGILVCRTIYRNKFKEVEPKYINAFNTISFLDIGYLGFATTPPELLALDPQFYQFIRTEILLDNNKRANPKSALFSCSNLNFDVLYDIVDRIK